MYICIHRIVQEWSLRTGGLCIEVFNPCSTYPLCAVCMYLCMYCIYILYCIQYTVGIYCIRTSYVENLQYIQY